MSGNGKHFVWLDYLTAYEIAWKGGIVSSDAPLPDGETRFVDSMESESPSPENILLRKEAFRDLSSEAKEVVLLVLNAPQEILDCFFAPKYHKISKEKIGQFLVQQRGWKRRIVDRCFQELKEFSMGIY
jgi:hypothetical protein